MNWESKHFPYTRTFPNLQECGRNLSLGAQSLSHLPKFFLMTFSSKAWTLILLKNELSYVTANTKINSQPLTPGCH